MDCKILKYKANIFGSQVYFNMLYYHNGSFWQKREAHSSRVLNVFNEGTIYRSVGRFEEINQKVAR